MFEIYKKKTQCLLKMHKLYFYKIFLRSDFRSDFRSELFFKVISDLKFSVSDPNFRSEICKFSSRSERKNFRSEN